MTSASCLRCRCVWVWLWPLVPGSQPRCPQCGLPVLPGELHPRWPRYRCGSLDMTSRTRPNPAYVRAAHAARADRQRHLPAA